MYTFKKREFHSSVAWLSRRWGIMDVWYSVAKSIVKTYLALFVDSVQIQGKNNLPPGPKIIVANHPHVTDGFVLPFIIPEKVHFLIQSETFSLPVLGKILALADQIPVFVGRGQEALEIARQKLDLGHVVAIFPEGRLSGEKEVRRAGAGATLLAINSGAPLVPVGFYVPPEFVRRINGRFYNRSTVGWWQFGGRCVVRIGEPWQPVIAATSDRSYRALRDLTDRMMGRVQELVQQAAASFQSNQL
jgi:1-acyl-sn-glycerol-3-phosphate acyltransferase